MPLTDSDLSRFAHLMRRAGFGARPADYQDLAPLGIEKATERLLHPETVNDPAERLLQEMGTDGFDFDDQDSLKRWWVYRMSRTQRPLVEKMTLFWHNHFATANYKVGNTRWMYEQNQTFRKNALGSFPALLKAMVTDAAMLSWLDGGQNRKDAPNENFARELMELFTMGVDGGYSETDVKEGARAFTGWRYDYGTSQVIFDDKQHDTGPKKFLGYNSRLGSDDVINILVRHPSTAKFVCGKLARFFIGDNVSAPMIESLAKTFTKSNFEIRPVVGAILNSPEFYDESNRWNKVKSPIEYSIGTMRALDTPVASMNNLIYYANDMGQDLFNPPNVKGWREGQTWLNTAALLKRREFVNQLADVMNRRNKLPVSLKSALLPVGRDADTLKTSDELVDALWFLLMPGRKPSDATRAALVKYARGKQDEPKAGEAKPAEKPLDFNSRAPGTMMLILAAPEYQLC